MSVEVICAGCQRKLQIKEISGAEPASCPACGQQQPIAGKVVAIEFGKPPAASSGE
jgi:hypothetical protein